MKCFCISLTISSCNSEELTTHETNIKSSTKKEVSLKELGYDSFEDALTDGWDIIYKVKQDKFPVTTMTKKIIAKNSKDEINENTQIEKPSINYPIEHKNIYIINRIEEKLDYDQIKSLKYYDYQLKNLYSSVFKSTPDGVAINDYGTKNAYRPLITNTYGWEAYLETGSLKVIQHKEEEIEERFYTVTLTNNSSKDDFLYNTFNVNTKIKIYLNVDVEPDIKIYGSTKLSIPIPDETIRTTINLGFGINTERDFIIIDKENFQNELYGTIVPAHSKTQILIKESIMSTYLNYELPINIYGYVGLNFPSKVNGHYFLYADASLLLKNTENKQTGDINIIKTLKTEIIAKKPEPILAIN